MDYTDYISNISFRFIKPDTPLLGPAYLLLRLIRKLGIPLEMFNTRFPYDRRTMNRRLRKICRVPKESTLAIGAIINMGVSQMPKELTFVNVGVWHGFTFLAGLIGNADKKCVGVDNWSQYGDPRANFIARFNKYKSHNHKIYEMDYREYFTNVHKGPIGFYFYDGDHAYEDQLKGLQIAEPFFAENCIILVDDTNWEAPHKATMDFIVKSSHDYQILLDEGTAYPPSHPTFWNGIILFKKSGKMKTL